jgi:hypothetical protein
MLTPHELHFLANASGSPLATIYLPTGRAGRELRANMIHLKNALAQLHDRAHAEGIDSRDAAAVLARPDALLWDGMFFEHVEQGLALFCSRESMLAFHLADPVDDFVLWSDRFCVRPLLPEAAASGRFFVLGLSQNRVRLIMCSPTGTREVTLGDDVPRRLTDVVGRLRKEDSLQLHSSGSGPARGGRRVAVFHGQGSGDDDNKAEIEQFLRRVDDGITALIHRSRTPLVVVAVGYEGQRYQSLSRYEDILGVVEGNPDRLSDAQLLEQALPLARPRLDETRRKALELVHNTAHSTRGVTDLAVVLAAAQEGRAETVLVRTGRPLWGRPGAGRTPPELHPEWQPHDDDLLDLCASRALRTGADVFAVAPESMPQGAEVAACLRW